MNQRISKKVYKRAEGKLLAYRESGNDNRSTFQIEREDHILTPLERRVFFRIQAGYLRVTAGILKELEKEAAGQ